MRSLIVFFCLLLVVSSTLLAEEQEPLLEELIDQGIDDILQSSEIGEVIRAKRCCYGCYGMAASPAPCGGCCG